MPSCLSGFAILLVFAGELAAAEPHWLWGARDRAPEQRYVFRHRFTLSGAVRRATLIGIADFHAAHLRLNGRTLVTQEPFAPRISLDVTAAVQRGDNELIWCGESVDGPAAFALELTIEQADGTQQLVVSDDRWQVAHAASFPHWPPDEDIVRQLATDRRAIDFGVWRGEPWRAAPDVDLQPFDDYEQWRRALGPDGKKADTPARASEPPSIQTRPGFEAELLRAAQPDEGSWISLTFDGQGRAIVSREDKGLLRIVLPADGAAARVAPVEDSLQEIRGLAFHGDWLYASANNAKALYRLRGTERDGPFDVVERVRELPGSVGHGRNDLTIGPDGRLYWICGDSVDVPPVATDFTSPFREARRGAKTREGFLLRFDPPRGPAQDGRWELLCAGLRNPFGIAFHPDGEPFTYDADAEFDMGAPWYRPTRIQHLVTGADFGWRGVTGQWPPYYPDRPDNAPTTGDIGKGSPTAVQFGTHSRFSPAYRRALFALDWAYGRILAVHLGPRGAGYAARAETFARGQPLNVTDLEFGPDGALYFVTGGRKTQSGLYRIRYTGPLSEEPPPTPQEQALAEHGHRARTLRRTLEGFHGRTDPQAIAAAWPYLGSADPWLRHAARIAIEHQPRETLLKELAARLSRETNALARATALLVLAREGSPESHRLVAQHVSATSSSPTVRAASYYAARLAAALWREPEFAPKAAAFASAFPDPDPLADRELSHWLLARGRDAPSTAFRDRLLARLATESDATRRLHDLFLLSQLPTETAAEVPEKRLAAWRSYLAALQDVERFVIGGQGMPTFVKKLREEATSKLSADEQTALAALLKPPPDDEAPVAPRPFVRQWQLADLVDALPAVGKERDRQRGRTLFAAAACSRCHRAGTIGGGLGPDLTAVSRRFSRRDLLESILAPSLVVPEHYRQARVIATDGRVLTGLIAPGGDYRAMDLRLVPNLLEPSKVVVLPKSQIESHDWSPLSPMPTGLLDTLSREEILDLLAYLEVGVVP